VVHYGGMSKNPARDAALVASLAAEIASERAYRKMTQQDVWTRAGLSPATYKKIENGKAGASRSFTHIWAIAQALGISADELIRRTEDGMPRFLPGAVPRVSDKEREDLRRAIDRNQPPAPPDPDADHPATGNPDTGT
jgi:transcriptional regulator with XRE-family HTH domain